jgi:hypothetical protein
MAGIKLDDYIRMIRKSAWIHAKRYGMEYEDMEAQGFLIYCMAVKEHNPAKASFSTFLYRNLAGRLTDYCLQLARRRAGVNIEKEDHELLDLISAREEFPASEFLQCAEYFLSGPAYSVLKWLIETGYSKPGGMRRPSMKAAAVTLGISYESVKDAWAELRIFWNKNGAAIFAEV